MMTTKNTTTFKIIGPLCLALCGVFSWYYLDTSSPAGHTDLPSHLVARQPNYILASNAANTNTWQHIKQHPSQGIVVIGIIASIALIIYVIYAKGYPYIKIPFISNTPGQVDYGIIATDPTNIDGKRTPTSCAASAAKQLGLPFEDSENSEAQHKKYLHDILIPKVESMIEGKAPRAEVTDLDKRLLHKLILNAKDIPDGVQAIWDQFRKAQQSISIDMAYMYCDYKLFFRLLFSSSIPNLLLLDKIAEIFPSATEIICKEINTTSVNDVDYASDTVNENFILALQACLRNMKQNKATQLKKIIITTNHYKLPDTFGVAMDGFEDLDWYIGKGDYRIVFTKTPYDDCMAKIKFMIQGRQESLYKVTLLDACIFDKLVAGDKDVPFDIENKWHNFRKAQQSITIDMIYMYQYYEVFILALFSDDDQPKNLLLFGKMAKIFPNATQIICKYTDCVRCTDIGETYSSDSIITDEFIWELRDRLSTIVQDQSIKLKKIMIKTDKHEIGHDSTLNFNAFDKIGWYIAAANKAIVIIDKAHLSSYCSNTFIPKIKAMIQGEAPNTPATAFDVFIFNKLASQGMLAKVQKPWNQFKNAQKSLTVDMQKMTSSYKLFLPLVLFSQLEAAHLLSLLDTLVKAFPYVAQITCINVDFGEMLSVEDIADTSFIEGLKDRLSKEGNNAWKNHSLKKITIKSLPNNPIKADLEKAYGKHFADQGWQIQAEEANDSAANQLTLAKIASQSK